MPKEYYEKIRLHNLKVFQMEQAHIDAMVKLIKDHTEKIIAAGPQACREFLQTAGIELKPITLEAVFEKYSKSGYINEANVKSAMQEWAETYWELKIRSFLKSCIENGCSIGELYDQFNIK